MNFQSTFQKIEYVMMELASDEGGDQAAFTPGLFSTHFLIIGRDAQLGKESGIVF